MVLSAAATPVQISALVWLRDEYRDFLRDGTVDLDSSYVTYSFLSTVAGLPALAATVLLIVLSFRLAKNHQAMGRVGGRFGPGWAIAGWLIPLASLVIPFLLLNDLWRGSDPDEAPGGDSWRRRPGGQLIYGWWALQLVTNLLSFVFAARLFWGFIDAFRDIGTGRETERLVESLFRDAIGWQIAVLCITAVAQMVGAVTVRALVKRQETYGSRHGLVWAGAGGPSAPWNAAAAPPPAWHPDPSRRHELRYWDGVRWTEQVADGGSVTSDPLPPA